MQAGSSRTAHEKRVVHCRLFALPFLTILLIEACFLSHARSAELGSSQKTSTVIREDLAYVRRTVWADAKSITRAPLAIGRVREITLRQVLIGAFAIGSIGVLIAGDEDIRGSGPLGERPPLGLRYPGFSAPRDRDDEAVHRSAPPA